MALQPSARFAGSVHTLRFNGVFTVGNDIATFPKDNGEITTGGAVSDPRGVRLLFADGTDLLDTTKRLPSHVYDDTTPAGAHPITPTDTVLDGLVVNASEEDISAATWAQNMRVFVKAMSDNVVSISTASDEVYLVRDTLTSGLGGDSGLPVLIIPIVLSGDEVASVTLDILIEIPHTVIR